MIIHYGSIIHFQELAAEISGLEKEKEELEAKLKKVFILFTYSSIKHCLMITPCTIFP